MKKNYLDKVAKENSKEWDAETSTHARAFYEALHGEGLTCPYGCKGHAALMYGLVSHLIEKHGMSEKAAWKKARQ